MRPRQWIKNLLVFAAPAASGWLFEPGVLVPSLWAFVAFCLVSASIYMINDVRDAEADRLHPTKRFRPVASGDLSAPTAVALAAVTALAGLTIGFLVNVPMVVTLATYWLLQLGYSLWWKEQPIIDLAMVASGFLLRAIAGGVATGIVLSQWFLLVASFGSLFMVAGKRYSEMLELGSEAGTRKALERYTSSYLHFVWAISVGAVIMSYSLWAFEYHGDHLWGVNWAAVSIGPFTLALLRYAMEIDAGRAGEPEDIILGDRILQILGVAWAIPVGLTVFG